MSIELKQAAEKALVVLGSATSFMSRKARDQHESAIAALRTAIQQVEAKTDEPVAYVCPTSHHANDGSMEDGPDYLEWADEASDYEKRVGTPLYTHPDSGVPDDVVRDAERYRWLLCNYLKFSLPDEAWKHGSLDAAIDAAKLAAK